MPAAGGGQQAGDTRVKQGTPSASLSDLGRGCARRDRLGQEGGTRAPTAGVPLTDPVREPPPHPLQEYPLHTPCRSTPSTPPAAPAGPQLRLSLACLAGWPALPTASCGPFRAGHAPASRTEARLAVGANTCLLMPRCAPMKVHAHVPAHAQEPSYLHACAHGKSPTHLPTKACIAHT